VCDLESSKTRQPKSHLSCSVTGGEIVINEDKLKKHTDHVNTQINLRYSYNNNDNNYLLFSDYHNTTLVPQ